MSILSRRLALALVLAALCPAGQIAFAQAAPLTYWSPGWIGFGGNLNPSSDANAYSSPNGSNPSRYNFSNGWFMGGGSGSMGLNGLSSASGNLPSLDYQSTQFGYNFQNTPVTVYGGLATIKYNPGNFGALTAFNSGASSATGTPGYNAHVGVEFKPASNVSLSFGMGYSQAPTADLNSLAANPFVGR